MLAHKGGIADKLPEGMDGPVEIAKGQEQEGQVNDAPSGNPERFKTILVRKQDEGTAEDGFVQVFKIEDVQCHMEADGQGNQKHGGNGHIADKVVEPGGTEEQGFAVFPFHIGDAVAQVFYPLV